MAAYQVQVLDSGGLKVFVHALQCSADDEAIAIAESLLNGGGIADIWEDSRNVGQIYVPLPIAAS